MWRHNYVIDRNEYLIFTLSESINPWVYSLQLLFKSTNNSWRYERKCEWVFFFWTQCSTVNVRHNNDTIIDVKTFWHVRYCRFHVEKLYTRTAHISRKLVPVLLWTTAIRIQANSCLLKPVHGDPDLYWYQCEHSLTRGLHHYTIIVQYVPTLTLRWSLSNECNWQMFWHRSSVPQLWRLYWPIIDRVDNYFSMVSYMHRSLQAAHQLQFQSTNYNGC